LPHLGRARGSDTGENSEICAGTRSRLFSSCVSGGLCGISRDAGTMAHHRRTPARTANHTPIVSALLFAVFALGHWERHRIGVLRAIPLPASANLPVFVLNHLLQTFLPDFCPWCNRLQTSRTTGAQRRWSKSSLRQCLSLADITSIVILSEAKDLLWPHHHALASLPFQSVTLPSLHCISDSSRGMEQ